MRLTRVLSLLFAFSLLAAACGSDDTATDAGSGTETTIEEDTTTAEAPSSTTADADADADADAIADDTGACAELPTKTAGVLTVATGEPVFEPWMVDDAPENGEGFESALVYALADHMGVEEVVWMRTGFDAAVAPGEKDFDFNIQQYSITADRDEVVDFSDGYYQVEQAIVGAADSDLAAATSLADLTDAQLGAAVGTTSLDYVEQVIKPSSVPLAFSDNASAKSAFDAGQVDGIVFDLPTAYFITAVEIPDATIIGVLPHSGEPEELGMLFEEGSPLVPCVNEALTALRDEGALDALQDQWLKQGGSIPSLSN